VLKRKLGRTKLDVSGLSMGTVSLGMDYGIRIPEKIGHPSESESIELLRAAADYGINFYDTAPVYGSSETVLGKALFGKDSCYIATKLSLSFLEGADQTPLSRENAILESINKSLKCLQRDVLDVLQVHNATVAVFDDSITIRALQRVKHQGLVKYIGASIYNEKDALAAIDSGIVDILQVPFSILDQRLTVNVLPAAESANVGILARSVLLQGVLSEKARYLPDHLIALKEGATRIKDYYDISWQELSQLAIRFCLGIPGVHSVLLGIENISELDVAMDAVKAGMLPSVDMNMASDFQMNDNVLLNPSNW